MSTVMPRSVLHHRPIAQDIPEFVVSTAHLNHQRSDLRSSLTPAKNQHPLVLVGLSMLITFLLLWVVQGIWMWSGMQLEALRYGYPRTTQVERVVGHGGVSSFIATNQQGQIYVLEIPAGNAAASHLLVGPHLIGSGSDLAPVHLTFAGNPRHPDLLVEVQGIALRFSNTGSTYIPVSVPS